MGVKCPNKNWSGCSFGKETSIKIPFNCLFWTRGAVHVHGHIHSGPLSSSSEVADFNPLRYDIGVDNNNLKPISYNNLKGIITKQLL